MSDLKAKLPFGKKARIEDDDLDENEGDSSQQDERTDVTDLSELGDEEESDEAAKKKKKNSKMIQIVIGVGLVLFLLSDYILPPSEEPAAPATSFKRPERKKPVPLETPTEPVAEATPEVSPEETSGTVETTPDSSVTVTSDESPGETVSPTPEPLTTNEPVIEDSLSTEPVISETPSSEAPSDDPSVPVIPDSPMVDSVDGGETSVPGDDSLTDQILQDLEKQAKGEKKIEQKKEYVSPPDYEYRGRGLVYNCQGKHWACVDAPSYKTCEDNSSSVKFLKKKTECYPFNVYESQKGCENMQNRMVSSSAKTNFCED